MWIFTVNQKFKYSKGFLSRHSHSFPMAFTVLCRLCIWAMFWKHPRQKCLQSSWTLFNWSWLQDTSVLNCRTLQGGHSGSVRDLCGVQVLHCRFLSFKNLQNHLAFGGKVVEQTAPVAQVGRMSGKSGSFKIFEALGILFGLCQTVVDVWTCWSYVFSRCVMIARCYMMLC